MAWKKDVTGGGVDCSFSDSYHNSVGCKQDFKTFVRTPRNTKASITQMNREESKSTDMLVMAVKESSLIAKATKTTWFHSRFKGAEWNGFKILD